MQGGVVHGGTGTVKIIPNGFYRKEIQEGIAGLTHLKQKMRGYRFLRSHGGGMARLVRPKSKKKLRQTIKPQARRTNGNSMEAIVAKLNPILRGWYGYFKQARVDLLREMDGWVRGRLRGILRKMRGEKGADEEGIIIAGEIDTLTPLGSSALKRPKPVNKPASVMEQNADWRAGCVREIRPSGSVGGARSSIPVPTPINREEYF